MTFQPGAVLYSILGARPEDVEVPHQDSRAPTTSDILYPVGKRWIYGTANAEYTLTSRTSFNGATTANWTLLGQAAGSLGSLTTQDLTVVTPTSGTIIFNGATNQLTTTGSNTPGTVTVSLVTAVVAPGSLTTTTTLASGTTLTAGSSLSVTTSAVIGTTLTATGGLTTLAALTQAGIALINTTGSAATTIGTGGTGAVNIGNATGNTAITGSLTATTTLTATLGNITATTGNFVSVAAGNGLLFNATTATGAASGPVVLNVRAGAVTFTSVSIAANADLTLTITNSQITGSSTQVLYSMQGATTGSALSVKSVTNSAGSSAIVVTNGVGATTTTANITLTFLVVN